MSTQTPTPTHASARLLTPHICYPNLLSDALTLLPTHTTTSYTTCRCQCQHPPRILRLPNHRSQSSARSARSVPIHCIHDHTPTFISPNLQLPHLHARPFGQLAFSQPWRQDVQSFTAHRRKRKASWKCSLWRCARPLILMFFFTHASHERNRPSASGIRRCPNTSSTNPTPSLRWLCVVRRIYFDVARTGGGGAGTWRARGAAC